MTPKQQQENLQNAARLLGINHTEDGKEMKLLKAAMFQKSEKAREEASKTLSRKKRWYNGSGEELLGVVRAHVGYGKFRAQVLKSEIRRLPGSVSRKLGF